MTRCDLAMPRGLARPIAITSPAQARVRRAILLSLVAAWCFAAAAQSPSGLAPGHRSFPSHALRGELVVGAVPMALLNGQPARLAPGARVRGQDNLLQLPTSVAGQPLVVHYTLEPSTGLLMDVWILNRTELANEPWPTNPAEAASWRFDPASQRWARP